MFCTKFQNNLGMSFRTSLFLFTKPFNKPLFSCYCSFVHSFTGCFPIRVFFFCINPFFSEKWHFFFNFIQNLFYFSICKFRSSIPFIGSVSYTHLRAHETDSYLVCRLLLEK